MANYLYNGIVLPELPEWDRESYPYCFIREVNASNATIYRLYAFASTDDFCVDDLVGGVAFKDGVACLYSAINVDGTNVWSEPTERTDIGYIGVYLVIVWTNTPIPDENGSVYLAASEPIPLLVKIKDQARVMEGFQIGLALASGGATI